MINGVQNDHRTIVAINPLATAIAYTGLGITSIILIRMFWIDVCLHTAFFLAFLPVFYFEFVAPMQSYTVIDDIFEIVQPEFINVALLTSLTSPQSLTKAVKLFNTELAENEQVGNIDSLIAINAQIKLTSYFWCEFAAGSIPCRNWV